MGTIQAEIFRKVRKYTKDVHTEDSRSDRTIMKDLKHVPFAKTISAPLHY
jgi:hypothetical protein